MANDTQYFAEVIVNWGKQHGDEQASESTGGQNWGYLSYEQSVAVNEIIVEAFKKLLDDSIGLGKQAAGIDTKVIKSTPVKTFK